MLEGEERQTMELIGWLQERIEAIVTNDHDGLIAEAIQEIADGDHAVVHDRIKAAIVGHAFDVHLCSLIADALGYELQRAIDTKLIDDGLMTVDGRSTNAGGQ
jgi:hypothetical protein